MEPLAPHIEQRILDSFARQRLMTAYGATITAMGNGFVEISLLPQDFLLRTAGLFHGGVITAVADSYIENNGALKHVATALLTFIKEKR